MLNNNSGIPAAAIRCTSGALIGLFFRLQHLSARHRTRAARRTVAGGTRGAMRASALHSRLCPGHAAFWASLEAYLTSAAEVFTALLPSADIDTDCASMPAPRGICTCIQPVRRHPPHKLAAAAALEIRRRSCGVVTNVRLLIVVENHGVRVLRQDLLAWAEMLRRPQKPPAALIMFNAPCNHPVWLSNVVLQTYSQQM